MVFGVLAMRIRCFFAAFFPVGKMHFLKKWPPAQEMLTMETHAKKLSVHSSGADVNVTGCLEYHSYWVTSYL